MQTTKRTKGQKIELCKRFLEANGFTVTAVKAGVKTVVAQPCFDDIPDDGYLRQRQLIPAVVPFSSATLWRKVTAGAFPAPVKLSARVTAWRVGEVRQWLADRAAESSALRSLHEDW